jgi:DNA-binding Lrp family transcriptional regulator
LEPFLLKCQLTYTLKGAAYILLTVMWVEPIDREAIGEKYISMFKHTLAQQVYIDLEQDYQFPRAVCRSLTEMFTAYMDLYFGGQRNPYQIIFNCVGIPVPPGLSSEEMAIVPVKLTIVDLEDVVTTSQKGVREMVKSRIVRITEEAFSQGGTLTQADVAIILGLSPRSVVRYIKELQGEGIFLHTRGNVKDIGPGVSHKTRIIELYLKGYEYTDIERRTKHSAGSIMRYIKEFSRVLILKGQDHSFGEMRIISDLSEKVLEEYLELIEKYQGEEYEDRLEQIRAMASKKSPWLELEGEAEVSP